MAEPSAAPEAAVADAPAAEEVKGVKLYVKNLDESINTEALLALFAPHGTVKKGEVKCNKDGKSKGFGQVTMSTQEEADKAVAALNDTKQGENTISVRTPPPPEAGVSKDGQKGDKGKSKGKGDKGKGKGKGGKAAAQPWANAYQPPAYPSMPQMPQMNPYMMQSMGYDPVYMQIMQQQMMTMQLYAMNSGQPMPGMPAPAEAAGKGKGKGKGKGGKDKGTKVEGTFTGKLKSINYREDKGYGFIDCTELTATYGRDVYVSSELVPKGAKVGDVFEFGANLDQRGQLRATNVTSKA